MIVTEYMENGALDRYLRVSPPHIVFAYGNVSATTIATVTIGIICKLENWFNIYI